MTDAEKNEHLAKELDHVAGQIRDGRFTQDCIETLGVVMFHIQSQIPPKGTEEEIVARMRAASEEKRQAETALEAYFWPLVLEAKTEKEARAILARVPDGVAKAFFVDHFVYQSKVIPRKAG